MTGILLEKIQQFQNNGSGSVFENVEPFDINIGPIRTFVWLVIYNSSEEFRR